MASKHTGAAFNHSCLKMPVNPSNQLPYTSYERKRVTHVPEDNSTNRQRFRKSAHFQGSSKIDTFLSPTPSYEKEDHQHSFSQVKEGTIGLGVTSRARAMNDYVHTKDSINLFLDFYESIPDYGDVKYLSDREFNIKLQHLKDQQKLLAGHRPTLDSDLSSKECEPSLAETSDVINLEVDTYLKNNPVKPDLVSSSSRLRPRISQINNLNIKQHEQVMKSDRNTRARYESKQQHNSYTNVNQRRIDKEDAKYKGGTPSTISISSANTSPVGSLAPLKSVVSPNLRINNYISDSDGTSEFRTKPNRNINEMILKEKYITPSRMHTSDAAAKQKHGLYTPSTTYIPTQSRPTSSDKHLGKIKVDSPTSIIDGAGIWDGFSVDDSVIKKSEYLYSDLESLLEEPYLSRSVPNSPTYKYSKSVAWKEPKITIPRPFKMTMRDEEDARINAIKHDIYSSLIDNMNLKEDTNTGHFKANPVPLETQLPLFEKIMHDQEMRRRKVKKQCISELRSQMRPFTFVTRDNNERRKHRLCCSTPDLRTLGTSVSPKPFKARPVPKNLFGSLVYQKMREDEYYRALKKKIRAEELLKASSLPPSMAAREHISQILSASAKLSDDSSFDPPKPRRSRMIPNYKTSHDLMRQELVERQRENISTSPQPFHLRTGELRPRMKRSSVTSSPYECFSSLASHERYRPRSALCPSGNRNNLASVLRIQSARRRLEHEVTQKREETKKLAEIKMKALTARRQPVWQALNYSTEEDLAIRVQTRREEERLRRERHQEEMELMLDRVERIPPLFLRQTQRKTTQRKNHPKTVKKSNMKNQMTLAYSSPDLFGGTDEPYLSDVSDDRSSKPPPKVVSINETAQTFQSVSNTPETSSREQGSCGSAAGKTNADNTLSCYKENANFQNESMRARSQRFEKSRPEKGNSCNDIEKHSQTGSGDEKEVKENQSEDEGGNSSSDEDASSAESSECENNKEDSGVDG